MTRSARSYTATELAAMLRAHARGSYPAAAAAELLIRHATWLHRDDFVHDHVHAGPAPWMAGADMWAWIDWDEAVGALGAGVLPCSGSEGRILRIAASIGAGVLIDLADCMTSLDEVNVQRVVHAIQHANGHPGAWPDQASQHPDLSTRRRHADDGK
jgi:hypothetical protein